MQGQFKQNRAFEYLRHPSRIQYGLFDNAYHALRDYFGQQTKADLPLITKSVDIPTLYLQSGTAALEYALRQLQQQRGVTKAVFHTCNCVNVAKAVIAVGMEPVIIDIDSQFEADYGPFVDDQTVVVFTHVLGHWELQAHCGQFNHTINDLSQVTFDDELLSASIANTDFTIYSTGTMKPTAGIYGGVVMGRTLGEVAEDDAIAEHVELDFVGDATKALVAHQRIRLPLAAIADKAVQRKCRFRYKTDEVLDLAPLSAELHLSQHLQQQLAFFEQRRNGLYDWMKAQRRQVQELMDRKGVDYVKTDYGIPNYFTLIVDDVQQRVGMGEKLAEQLIETTWNYLPLGYYQQFKPFAVNPKAYEQLWPRLISVPFMDFSSGNRLVELYDHIIN